MNLQEQLQRIRQMGPTSRESVLAANGLIEMLDNSPQMKRDIPLRDLAFLQSVAGQAIRYDADESDLEGDSTPLEPGSGEELAGWYASVFNALEAAGVDFDSQLDSANDELSGSGWYVDFGNDGKWKACPEDEIDGKHYAAAHAPKGGVSIGGKHFKGGQFIPAAVMAKATAAEKEAVENPKKERDAKRRSRGTVDKEKLRAKIGTHVELAGTELRSAKLAFAALKSHHGELTVHRLDEIADKLREGLDALPEDDESLMGATLRRELAKVGHMLTMAEGAGISGYVLPEGSSPVDGKTMPADATRGMVGHPSWTGHPSSGKASLNVPETKPSAEVANAVKEPQAAQGPKDGDRNAEGAEPTIQRQTPAAGTPEREAFNSRNAATDFKIETIRKEKEDAERAQRKLRHGSKNWAEAQGKINDLGKQLWDARAEAEQAKNAGRLAALEDVATTHADPIVRLAASVEVHRSHSNKKASQEAYEKLTSHFEQQLKETHGLSDDDSRMIAADQVNTMLPQILSSWGQTHEKGLKTKADALKATRRAKKLTKEVEDNFPKADRRTKSSISAAVMNGDEDSVKRLQDQAKKEHESAIAKEESDRVAEEEKAKSERFKSDLSAFPTKRTDTKRLASLISGQRVPFGRTALESGWATDGKFALLMTPEEREKITPMISDVGGRAVNVPSIVDTVKNAEPAKAVGVRTREVSKFPELLLQTEDGRQAVVDSQYHNLITQRYKDAVPYVQRSKDGVMGAILYRTKDGKPIGLVMPINDPTAHQGKHQLDDSPAPEQKKSPVEEAMAKLKRHAKPQMSGVAFPHDGGDVVGDHFGTFGVHKNKDGWSVTHLPSGKGAGSFGTKWEAATAAKLFGSKGLWQFADLKEIPQESKDHYRKVLEMVKAGDWQGLAEMIPQDEKQQYSRDLFGSGQDSLALAHWHADTLNAYLDAGLAISAAELDAIGDELGGDAAINYDRETHRWLAGRAPEGRVLVYGRAYRHGVVWESDDELLRYAAEDWKNEPGPRSKNRWVNTKSGRVVYSQKNPGGAGKGKAADKPAAKGKPKAKEAPSGKPIDAEALKAKLAPHAGDLDAKGQRSAKLSFSALLRHHGDRVLERIGVMADDLQKAHAKATASGKADVAAGIAAKLKGLHSMIGMVQGGGKPAAETPKAEPAPQAEPERQTHPDFDLPEGTQPASDSPFDLPEDATAQEPDLEWDNIPQAEVLPDEPAKPAAKPKAAKPKVAPPKAEHPKAEEPAKPQAKASEPKVAESSPEDFTLQTAKDLIGGFDYGMAPIHKLRDAVAEKFGSEAASDANFNKMILGMYRQGKIDLLSLSDLSQASREEIKKGIPGVGELLFYVTLPEGAASQSASEPAKPQAGKDEAAKTPAKPQASAPVKPVPQPKPKDVAAKAKSIYDNAAFHGKQADVDALHRDLQGTKKADLVKIAAAVNAFVKPGDTEEHLRYSILKSIVDRNSEAHIAGQDSAGHLLDISPEESRQKTAELMKDSEALKNPAQRPAAKAPPAKARPMAKPKAPAAPPVDVAKLPPAAQKLKQVYDGAARAKAEDIEAAFASPELAKMPAAQIAETARAMGVAVKGMSRAAAIERMKRAALDRMGAAHRVEV